MSELSTIISRVLRDEIETTPPHAHKVKHRLINALEYIAAGDVPQKIRSNMRAARARRLVRLHFANFCPLCGKHTSNWAIVVLSDVRLRVACISCNSRKQFYTIEVGRLIHER